MLNRILINHLNCWSALIILFWKYSGIHRKLTIDCAVSDRDLQSVCVTESEDALTDCVVCMICFAVSGQLFEIRFLK